MYYSFNGLLHPVVEKPLESTATALHPLPKKSPENTQKIQFHSEKGSKATQKVDLFAEQNAKQAEKQATRAKKRKRNITATVVIVGIIIVGVLVIILVNSNKSESNLTPSEINENEAQSTYQDAINQINSEAINGFPSNENISEANAVFEESIFQAVDENNTNMADSLRVAQMLFYNDVSTNYEKIIEIGESVEDIQSLEPIQQLRFYNLMATAYSAVGDKEKSIDSFFKAVVIAESFEE